MTADHAATLVAEYLAFIEHAPPPHFFWHAPEGDVLMAAGCARSLDPVNAGDWRRWAVSEAEVSDTRASSDTAAAPGMPFIALIGFAPGESMPGGSDGRVNDDGRWSGFPRARFYQPRQALLRRNGEERRWTDGRQETLPRSGEEAQPQSIDVIDWDREGFITRVRTALALLREGDIGKVVLARQCQVRLRRPADLGQSLRRMLAHPYSFSICHSPDGEQYFFSATPERLGRIDHGRFETMALAGTAEARRSDGRVGEGESKSQAEEDAEDLHVRLLGDEKERTEHAYVVEMIRDAASTFATGTEVQDVRVLELPHVRHMLTQISGQMAPECGMRHLIAALHPTPAVAGTPRAEAMRLIAELEPFDRGMYAGCAGWFVGDGDGDAAVTIRSALVRGTDATLWSGAGIVRHSDVEAEERETRVKLQTMLDVLGA